MRRFRVLAGLVVTVVGAVWLVERLGGAGDVMPVIWGWWPAAAIALGILNLLALIKHPARLLAPLLLIVGGGMGLLATVGDGLPDNVQPYVWPVVVTLTGIAIALWERERIEGDQQLIRQTAVLRSRRFHSTTTRFQHGMVRAYLGNLELDLQRCEIKQNAELCVTVVLGHVDLRPPPFCQVQLKRPLGPAVAVPALTTLDPKVPKTKLPVLEVSVMGFMGGFSLRPTWDPAAAVARGEATAAATPLRPAVSAETVGRRP